LFAPDPLGSARFYARCGIPVEYPDGDPRAASDKDLSRTPRDINAETLREMIADCAKFESQAREIVAAADATGKCKRGPDCDTALERAGRDFWLTRNGHGVGFWDGDWPEPMADHLTEISKKFGEFDLYNGDNGQVYGQ
jgi:hypothetical protein